MKRTVVAGVFGLSLGLSIAVSAHAEGMPPATVGVLQLDAGFRYGIDFDEGDLNPFGLGIGIGIGYTLPCAIYVGGVFDYFFGGSVEEQGLELSDNVWQVMGEGGYDLALSERWVFRGKGGLGYAGLMGEFCYEDSGGGSQCDDSSDGGLAVAPGIALMYLGESFSFSADARYDLIFGDDTLQGLIISAGIGF